MTKTTSVITPHRALSYVNFSALHTVHVQTPYTLTPNAYAVGITLCSNAVRVNCIEKCFTAIGVNGFGCALKN